MVNEFSATQNHWWISGTCYEGAIGCAVMRETNPRKRLLAHRIDAKAHEILASRKPWHPGIVEFSSPFTDLTPRKKSLLLSASLGGNLKLSGEMGARRSCAARAGGSQRRRSGVGPEIQTRLELAECRVAQLRTPYALVCFASTIQSARLNSSPRLPLRPFERSSAVDRSGCHFVAHRQGSPAGSSLPGTCSHFCPTRN
jgi:hypothetical protein